MKTILITGASGFIGRAATNHFRDAGWKVIGTGRKPVDDPHYLMWDLTQNSQKFPAIERRLAQWGTIDVILHGAARSSPWGSHRAFEGANVAGTRKVLELAERLGKPKLVFISSSSVYYEERDQLEITEQTPFATPPINRYADSKQRAEQLVKQYTGRWCIARPRAVYGKGDTVLFPRILKAAQAGRLPLIIRSGTPALGDLLSIDNLCIALERLCADDSLQGDFNLTDNQPVEINAFLLSVFDRLGIQRPIRQVNVRAAYRVAWVLEKIYGTLCPWLEPPITRFGVHVFAYSKTFRVDKMLTQLGSPRYTVDESLATFVNWVKTCSPYPVCQKGVGHLFRE